MSESHFAVSVSGPPERFTPKPKSREKTISGSMALRERSEAKSPTVKKLTISVESGVGSSTVPAAASVHAVKTGG